MHPADARLHSNSPSSNASLARRQHEQRRQHCCPPLATGSRPGSVPRFSSRWTRKNPKSGFVRVSAQGCAPVLCLRHCPSLRAHLRQVFTCCNANWLLQSSTLTRSRPRSWPLARVHVRLSTFSPHRPVVESRHLVHNLQLPVGSPNVHCAFGRGNDSSIWMAFVLYIFRGKCGACLHPTYSLSYLRWTSLCIITITITILSHCAKKEGTITNQSPTMVGEKIT